MIIELPMLVEDFMDDIRKVVTDYSYDSVFEQSKQRKKKVLIESSLSTMTTRSIMYSTLKGSIQKIMQRQPFF